jgi:hypothetical protein
MGVQFLVPVVGWRVCKLDMLIEKYGWVDDIDDY